MQKMKNIKEAFVEREEDLCEWRYMDEVLHNTSIVLAIQGTDPAKKFVPLYFYDKTNYQIHLVNYEISGSVIIPVNRHYAYFHHGHERERDDYSMVRLFDIENGCAIPWPEKPWPSVKDYVASVVEYNRTQQLLELSKREAEAKLLLKAIEAKKAALLSEQK
jgi:hypothetical protein